MDTKLSQAEIAKHFSEGRFGHTYPYLSETILWEVVAENRFEGKKAVVANCEQTAVYFASVETRFKTEDIIQAGNKVVVAGSAEFIRQGKRVNFVSACDVYEFNDDNQLLKITSYCIPEKD